MDELSAELKAKYPTAHYAPLSDCERCQGKGQRWYESHSPYAHSGWLPCVCIFVRHEHVSLVLDVIRTIVVSQ